VPNLIRDARPADLDPINDIYNRYLLHSTATLHERLLGCAFAGPGGLTLFTTCRASGLLWSVLVPAAPDQGGIS